MTNENYDCDDGDDKKASNIWKIPKSGNINKNCDKSTKTSNEIKKKTDNPEFPKTPKVPKTPESQ